MNIHIKKSSFFFLLFFFFSCSEIRLIQEYDPVSENKITLLQEKSTRFFIKLERNFSLPENKYEKFIDFYDDIQSDIRILETRSKSIDKTEIIQQQLNALSTQFISLEELHKKGFKSKEEILVIESAINTSYVAILKLQVALKNKKI